MNEDIIAWVVGGIFALLLPVLIWAVVLRYKYIKKYGVPKAPADINEIKERLRSHSIQIETKDFFLVKRHKNTNFRYRKLYQQADGVWTLDVEIRDQNVIAYIAEFKSSISCFLNWRYSGYIDHPRLMTEFQD
jgi:hypothetical protein